MKKLITFALISALFVSLTACDDKDPVRGSRGKNTENVDGKTISTGNTNTPGENLSGDNPENTPGENPNENPGNTPAVGEMTRIAGEIVNFNQLQVREGLSLKLTADDNRRGYPDVILAEAVIAADGSFVLTLPATVDANLMSSLRSEFDDLSRAVSVSDPNVLVADADLVLYAAGRYVGELEYEGYTSARAEVEAELIFAGGNTEIRGSFRDEDDEEVYDIAIKAGWNWCYSVDERVGNGSERNTTTTTVPATAELRFRASVNR